MIGMPSMRQRVEAALFPSGWPVYGSEDRERYAGHNRDGMVIGDGGKGTLVLRPIMGSDSYEFYDRQWQEAYIDDDFELEPLYAENDRGQVAEAISLLNDAGIAAEASEDGRTLTVPA